MSNLEENQIVEYEYENTMEKDYSNLGTLCRTCGRTSDYLIPIFSEDGLRNNLAELINKHLPITVSPNDEMPHVLCNKCVNTITEWDELKQLCLYADATLRQHIGTNEVPETNQIEENEIFIIETFNENVKTDLSVGCYEKIEKALNDYLNELNIVISGDMEFSCLKCEKEHSRMSLQILTEHLSTTHYSESDNFNTFIREYIVFEETLASAPEDNRNESSNSDDEVSLNYNCSYCHCKFSSVSRLTLHLNSHKKTSLNGIICCKRYYKDKNSLQKHLKEEHVSYLEKGTCRSCDFRTDNEETLQLHIIEKHDIKTDRKPKPPPSAKSQKYIPAVCPECNKTFSNKYNMFVHLQRHTDTDARHRCDACGKTYRSRSNLAAHARLAHRGLLTHACPRCAERFPTRTARDVHAATHARDPPYRCTYCGKAYRAKNTLDRHIDMHNNVRKYECEICSKKSSRPQFYSCNAEFNGDSADAGGDRDTASDEEDEPLSALASKKSSNLYDTFYRALVNFRDHFASEHRTKSLRSGLTDSEDSELSADSNESMSEISPSEPRDVDKYDDLTEQNRRKNHLDEQTRDELNQARRKIDGKVFYTCSICEKNLSSRHTYLFHQRIHTGERPCVCHLCGKQFRAPPGLRRHLAHTHERRRPRACPLCARAFASQQNLRQHLRTHTGERPYVCPLCNKRFTQGGSLHVHLRSHGSAAPHRCVDCGKRFKLRANLARHRLHHTGERPHACPHCARRFAHRHELAAHRAAHLSVAPHACTRCGAAFKQRRALRDHARRHHPAAL